MSRVLLEFDSNSKYTSYFCKAVDQQRLALGSPSMSDVCSAEFRSLREGELSRAPGFDLGFRIAFRVSEIEDE